MDSKELEQEHQEFINNAMKYFGVSLEQLKHSFLSRTGQIEALDRTYIQSENFITYVLQHPFVLLNKEMYTEANSIHERMVNLYQLIGSKDYAEDKTN